MALVMPQGPPFGQGAPWSQPPTQQIGMRPPFPESFMGNATPPMPPPSTGFMPPFPPMSSPPGPPPVGYGMGSPPGSFRGPPPTTPFDSMPPRTPPMSGSIPGLPPNMSGSFASTSGPTPFDSMPGRPPMQFSGSFPAMPPSGGPMSFDNMPGRPPMQSSGSFPPMPPSGSFQTMLPPGAGPPSSMGSFPPGSMGPSFPQPPGSMGPSFRPPTSGFATLPPFGPNAVNPGMRPMSSFVEGTGSLDMSLPGNRGYYGEDIDGNMRSYRDNLGHLHTTFGHQNASMKDLMNQPLFVDEAPPPSDRPLHVGPYYSLFGAPLTPQYGIIDADSIILAQQKEWKSKLKPYWSYGRAQLRNIVDVETETFAEKLVNPWQWCFIHADGWLINFWACNQETLTPDFDIARRCRSEAETQPAASVDMRQIFAVHCLNDASSAEGALCPWEIHLNFQRGFLPIRVESEVVAKEWNKRVMQAVVENTKIQQMREKDAEIMAGIEEFGEHQKKDLVRMRRLKNLWMEAIACVAKGSKVRREIFYKMHSLYDTAGARYGEEKDHQLSLNEVYVMASELMEVKTETIKMAVLKEERLLHNVHRPITSQCEEVLRKVVSDGMALLDAYKHMSNPQHFMDRVVNFHARTDISREGKVDLEEFVAAAPLFLLPEAQLRAEGHFLRMFEHSADLQRDALEGPGDSDD